MPVATTTAFTRAAARVRSFRCDRRPLVPPPFVVSTRLSLSLDDSWEQVAAGLVNNNAASATTPWSTIIEKQLTTAWHWTEFVSPAWNMAATDLPRYWVTHLSWLGAGGPLLLLLVQAVVVVVATALLYQVSHNPASQYRAGHEPYTRSRGYDPVQAQTYYTARPYLVAQRVAQLVRMGNRFLWNVAVWDKYVTRREVENRGQRAQELLQLITQLGPTAIKVGQALSVRPDLIPKEYATALASLQDQVPPFDGTQARAVLLEQLGVERFNTIKGLGLEQNKGPVASASIGQVYRGYIEDKQVAVKVQRPNVLAEIALDLYIVREFAPIYQKFTGGSTDLQALANEWGRGFIAELDYRAEAISTTAFNQEMQRRNLNAVCAPTVVTEYSTERILVTEWVEGRRLDQSDADDVPRLCSVALNAYLVMLLELQSLHCDPHPGNLLRTTDGRLCILDFGMTLDVDPTLQYSLLEFVAHLTSEDYDKLPEDLVRLGFLKPEKLDFARRSGILEPLKYFLKQAGEGGGASGVTSRIFADYREKYPGKTDDELRVEMRAEMKVRMYLELSFLVCQGIEHQSYLFSTFGSSSAGRIP
jgi:hypothetical protein